MVYDMHDCIYIGPGRINQGYNPSHKPLYEGMFFSDGKFYDMNFQ